MLIIQIKNSSTSYNILMAESTISIKPFSKEFTQQSIRQAFATFALKRIHVNHAASEAFVEFESANDVQALSIAYEDCKVPTLANAQIGFVEAGFVWPKQLMATEQEQGLIEIVEVNRQCLVSIKQCSTLHQLSSQQIFNIFKKYSISKLVRFDETNEVIIEFPEVGNLEVLEIDFEDYKVPQLGPKAFIDTGSVVDLERFIKRYKMMKKQQTEEKKKEEKQKEQAVKKAQQKKEEQKIKIEQSIREKQMQEEEAEKKKVHDEKQKRQRQQKQRKFEKQAAEKQAREEEERKLKEQKDRRQQQQIIQKSRKLKEEIQAELIKNQQEQQKVIALQKEKQQKEKLEKKQKQQLERKRKDQQIQKERIKKLEAEEKEKREAEERKRKEDREREEKRQREEKEKKENEEKLLKEKEEKKKSERLLEEELKRRRDAEDLALLSKPVREQAHSSNKCCSDYSSKLPSVYILMVLMVWAYYVTIR